MSYADAAAKGPKQSPEEARAPPAPEVVKTESTSSLVDVDSRHVSSVPSDFMEQDVQTSTQANRIELEDDAAAAKDKARSAAADAKARGRKAGDKARREAGKLEKNKDNPVVVVNGVLVVVGSAVLGWGAYQRFREGKLDWATVGTVAGVVGLVGAVDYYASQWLLKNKYPPKE